MMRMVGGVFLHLFSLLVVMFCCAEKSLAVPLAFTYEGYLEDSNGPVNTSGTPKPMVFELYGNSGSNCLLLSYTANVEVNSGQFSVLVGSSTGGSLIPGAASQLAEAFRPSPAFSTPCSFDPSVAGSRRFLRVFVDGVNLGDVQLSSAPTALVAQRVGTSNEQQLLRLAPGAGTATALTASEYSEFQALLAGTSAQYLSPAGNGTYNLSSGTAGNSAGEVWFDSVSNTLKFHDGTSVQTVSTSGGGGGSVTSVTSANSDIGITNTTTTPLLTLNSGTGANQILKLDGTGALPPVSGANLTNVNAVKIQGHAVDSITPAEGMAFRWNNGSLEWEPVYFGIDDLRTSIGAQQFASASCASHQTLTWSAITDAFSCVSIAIGSSQVNFGSQSANQIFAAPSGGSGLPTFRSLTIQDLPAGGYDLSYFKQGGSSFGSTGILGTNDNFDLQFRTNNSTRMVVSSNGRVGVGASALSPTAPLMVAPSMLMSGSGQVSAHIRADMFQSTESGALRVESNPSSGSAGAYHTAGLHVVAHTAYGANNSGGHVGLMIDHLRHHDGVLGDSSSADYMEGLDIKVGHDNTGSGVENPTTNSVVGLQVRPFAKSGSITNFYGLQLRSKEGANSISNYYGVYQEDSTAKNYFAGAVGVGTSNPSMALDVNGAVNVASNLSVGSALNVGGTVNAARAVTSQTNIINSGSSVDLSLSNVHILKSPGGSAISLMNGMSGGSYTLIVSDMTSRTYTFSGCNNSYFNPVNGPTMAGTRSTYTVLYVVDGGVTDCYISWVTGFN